MFSCQTLASFLSFEKVLASISLTYVWNMISSSPSSFCIDATKLANTTIFYTTDREIYRNLPSWPLQICHVKSWCSHFLRFISEWLQNTGSLNYGDVSNWGIMDCYNYSVSDALFFRIKPESVPAILCRQRTKQMLVFSTWLHIWSPNFRFFLSWKTRSDRSLFGSILLSQ